MENAVDVEEQEELKTNKFQKEKGSSTWQNDLA